MSARAYRLVVAAPPTKTGENIAVLGRDIRARPEEIARHCWAEHRAINEDIATVAESVALADRMFRRHRGRGWSRDINIEVPVFQLGVFQQPALSAALTDALHFLTGDLWNVHFVKRPGRPLSQGLLPFEKIEYAYVTPYSDGLDSFSQVKLLEKRNGPNSVLKLRSARIGQDSDELQKPVLRVPRGFGSKPKPEQSYRSRPFVFFSFAGIGALVAKAEAVVVGESGQGALGPALIRYAGEWPFRSTHPGFIRRIERYLAIAFEQPIRFQLPQIWRTKGEVLQQLADEGLLERWDETTSCSVRPNNRHGAAACGICGGCLLRSLAVHKAGLEEPALKHAFSIWSEEAAAVDGASMSKSERQMAVRSMGTIVEFARLAENGAGTALIKSESAHFGDIDRAAVISNLNDLASRHALEWRGLSESLPSGGWARAFADQL